MMRGVSPLSLHHPEHWPALLNVTEVAELLLVDRHTIKAMSNALALV